MIVYGDHARRVAPQPALHALADGLAAEGATVDAFVDAAALAQGLIDAEFHARGAVDARSPLADALGVALTRLAGDMLHGAPPDAGAWRALARQAPPQTVSVKLAEGFAFYALDPRAYAASARAAGLGPDTTVIGLRSIGTALAAVVAAAVGARPPITVRPVDHPFARRLSLAPELRAELARAPGRIFVVDEGPGLSGSSFLSVADALAEAGIARDRLVLLPGHPNGPGAQAPEEARTLFREARVLAPTPPDTAAVVEVAADLIGPALASPEELSGGAWRADLSAERTHRPPAAALWEHRKVRVRTARGTFLLKWAGFGGDAWAKLARARRLAEAGCSPPVLELRDGWLVAPWLPGRPLGPGDAPPLPELAAMLTLRARDFHAASDEGASPAALAEMARVNAGEALGAAAGGAAEALVARGLGGPAPARVMIDGRLHRHEWLRTPDGRTLKTDALDHARGHDLIGPQEIGWDVAGAAVEWDLTPAETAALAETAGADPARLPALTAAYCAFQLGTAAMAADAAEAADRLRLLHERDRYAARLRATLD